AWRAASIAARPGACFCGNERFDPLTSVAIMNAKGGVGKSTLTMALAETLSAFHGKRVLVIDSDGQMSLSVMVLPVARLTELRDQGKTITGFLASLLPGKIALDWRTCIAGNASDVDDARSLSAIAGDMDLALIERDIVASGEAGKVQERCKVLLREAKEDFDLVLVDCAPGISVITECWLRECEWHLIPVKPDILAVSGIQYLKNFRQRTPEAPFARHLGVAINMKQTGSETGETIHELLLANGEMACFADAVPMIQHIQKSALCTTELRSFQNKYPGEAGRALRAIAAGMLQRVSANQPAPEFGVEQALPPFEQELTKPLGASRKAWLDKPLGPSSNYSTD
ncbi:MAG: ParA family protein, partial [Rhodomicrobium sp.]